MGGGPLGVTDGGAQGSWKASVNLATVLTSLRLLLAEPNPDDPLMDDIAALCRGNRAAFAATVCSRGPARQLPRVSWSLCCLFVCD